MDNDGSPMPKLTIVFGVMLIVLGAAAYFATGQSSLTAMIPAAFGTVLLFVGALACRQRLRKHAMHAASIVGLLGLVGGLERPVRAAIAGEIHLTAAVIAQLLMALVCGVYFALCVRSFVQARLSPRE
jgi:hypothetical protein